MRVNKSGWIKLYRQLLLSDLWQDKPFARGQAWVDLLLLYDKNANRLQISQRELSRRWGWSLTKVRNFLAELQEHQDLELMQEQKKTTLLLAKYRFFQEIAYTKKSLASAVNWQKPEALKNKQEKEKNSALISNQALLDFWEKQR
ncbi:MAG: hypothetical protein Q4G02_00380 [bacterium]|nr:hypothetical protein [bacterium]